MRSRPACSSASRSSTGVTILQGGHQSAVKSTSTGRSLARTSAAKVASDVSGRWAMRDLLELGSVDGGDEAVGWVDLGAALADQARRQPVAAAAVAVGDVRLGTGGEVSLAPVRERGQRGQQGEPPGGPPRLLAGAARAARGKPPGRAHPRAGAGAAVGG